MLRFFSIEQGVIKELEPSSDTSLEVSIRNAHWIDTINPTEDERNTLAKTLNITCMCMHCLCRPMKDVLIL
jgi:magnesium transporter